MKLIDLYESNTLELYHLTDDANFSPDPSYSPEDNAVSIHDRSGQQGIYLAKDVETWVNGKGYWRPFVVVFKADPAVVDLDNIGRWGGEVFVAAENFNMIKIERVIPIDAWARERYGIHGWLEASLDVEFDTGKPITAKGWEQPFKGYKYPHDLRSASTQVISHLKQHFLDGMEKRG